MHKYVLCTNIIIAQLLYVIYSSKIAVVIKLIDSTIIQRVILCIPSVPLVGLSIKVGVGLTVLVSVVDVLFGAAK